MKICLFLWSMMFTTIAATLMVRLGVDEAELIDAAYIDLLERDTAA